ncbi:MAG: MaoC family dehydratase [Candidatus Methylomirabilales bacterium]
MPDHRVGRTIEELRVGEAAVFTKTVSASDIETFARLTGDSNPLHTDPAFAKTTRFGERIAQGMLSASIISAVIGTKLPGPGAIYVSQDLRFLRPVKIGDTIVAKVEVVELHREKNRVKLRTTCLNQRGEEVIDGFALVIPPTKPTA